MAYSPIILQTVEGRVTSDQSTTSASFVDLPLATITITTTTGSKVLVIAGFSSSNTNIGGATNNFRLVVDGSATDGGGIAYGAVGQSIPILNGIQGGSIIRLISGLSAGSHTLKLQFSTTSGTVRVRPVTAPGNEYGLIVVVETRL